VWLEVVGGPRVPGGASLTSVDSASSAPVDDPRHLAETLAPVLAEACEGRLSRVTWFRTDWQRGGAATGTALYQVADGGTVAVVVKLPVVHRELLWMRRLQDGGDNVVPRLYASGETLGGYDLSWLVIEHFDQGPLGTHWHDDHVTRIADAAARFQLAALTWPVDQPAHREPWEDLIKEAQKSLRNNPVQRRHQWRAALKTLRSHLHSIVEDWEARDTAQWVHGDLHLANAMSRESMESGPVCLIDLAEVRVGHWVEDAVYLERQLWARPQRLKGHGPVKAIAAARRRWQLPVEDDYPRLAMIRRALLAGTALGFLQSEGDPRYLGACLGWLERAVVELKLK